MASEAEANFNWKWILALGKCIFEYMCQIFITERDVPVSRLPAVTFPDTSQPVINPVFFPVLASNQRLPKLQIFFISGRFLMGSALADNQKIVHKIISWINSCHKKKTLLTKIELGVGGYQCLTRECAVHQPNLHKVHDNPSRGAYFTNLQHTWHMTKARLSAAFQRSCQSTHLFCNNTRMF